MYIIIKSDPAILFPYKYDDWRFKKIYHVDWKHEKRFILTTDFESFYIFNWRQGFWKKDSFILVVFPSNYRLVLISKEFNN